MQSTNAFSKERAQEKQPSKKNSTAQFEAFYEERRADPRNPHEQPVRVYLCTAQGQLLDFGWAQIKDVSAGGIKIKGLNLFKKTKITEKHRLVLEIVASDSILLKVRTILKWLDEKTNEWGFKFEQVSRVIV